MPSLAPRAAALLIRLCRESGFCCELCRRGSCPLTVVPRSPSEARPDEGNVGAVAWLRKRDLDVYCLTSSSSRGNKSRGLTTRSDGLADASPPIGLNSITTVFRFGMVTVTGSDAAFPVLLSCNSK